MSRQQDSSFNERKLRPIYDCLDNGCYKKALQEIDKLLKKAKDWQYAKVLKSLTLIRMNRQKEAAVILSDVSVETPTDDSTLQTMTICYRELQQNEMIAEIYEKALKKDPLSEKLHTHLFMAYVRLQDYKKQQISALNLFKVHQKNPYYFWAVMSIYMQAITSNQEAIASKITLPLAEKMCQKFFKENKFEAKAELELYLMILEKQNKYTEMIEIIDSKIGQEKLQDYLGFVLHRKIQFLKHEKRYVEAFDGLVKLINMNNDQYDYYIEAFKVATLLDNLERKDEKSDFEYTFKLLDLIDSMCKLKRLTDWRLGSEVSNEHSREFSPKHQPRGPFLAKILVLSLIKQSIVEFKRDGDNTSYSKFLKKIPVFENEDYSVDLICDYFERFGFKFVCVKDIVYLLHNLNLTEQQIQKLLMKIQFSSLSLNNENSIDEVQKTLCYYYLNHYNRQSFSVIMDERVSEAIDIFDLYRKTFDLVQIKCSKGDDVNTAGSEDKATDRKDCINNQQPFDPIIFLVVNKIFADFDIYDDNSSLTSSTMFDMIVLLEWALANNKYDFYIKLLLIRLYNCIGAASSSHALYESLDIKLIQNDTLGHFFLEAPLSTGLYLNAQQFLNSCWKFYTFNFKEAADYTISCYKYGSFTKIEEISSFNYKLKNSIQYHFSFIERFYLNLLVECKNHLSFSNFANDCLGTMENGNFDIEWDSICDNRDLQLLNSNHHRIHSEITNILREKTFTDNVLWLRFRVVLLQSLIASNCLANKINDNLETNSTNNCANSTEVSLDLLDTLVEKLRDLISISEASVTKYNYKYYLEGPAPSRLNSYFSKKYWQPIVIILSNIHSILKMHSMQPESNTSTIDISDLSLIFDDFFKDIEKHGNTFPAEIPFQTVRKILEDVTILVETIGVCISLLDISYSIVQKFTKLTKKIKKKKPDCQQSKENEQFIQTFNDSLTASRSTIENNVKRLLSLLNDNFVNSIKEQTSRFDYQMALPIGDVSELVGSVKSKIGLSYSKSFSELTTVLQNKQKYILSLNT